MNSYLKKLHANKIHFSNAHEHLLRNLFYLADRLKDEDEIRINIYGGYEKYRDCVKKEKLNGIKLTSNWERDEQGYRVAAYHAVIKPKVLLAQLYKYCVA